MNLNYNFYETLKLLYTTFKYNIMWAIVISCILFTLLLIINKNNKYLNYIIMCINIIIIILIGYYYIDDILKLKFSNPLNNIYFYFFNAIIYLIIMCVFNFKVIYKNINFILYGLSLINILFSLFMTMYLKNVDLIVIGNIYPMIKFGNIIYIIYYVFIFINFLFLTKKY